MADFSALKAAIQAVIKQNGNQEITGPILQEVLLSMVNTMGDGAINSLASALSTETTNRQNADGTLQNNINSEATARQNADEGLQNSINSLQTAVNSINTRLAEGYVYVGIATAATNPGTPAGKVFYIATAAGTYTNFSSLAVTQGITILKYNGTAWSQDNLLAIDNVPKKNGTNMVTSGGIFANIGAFDISEYHKSGSTLATYADLTAALAALPSDYQKGGMSIKFVLSSDNKYVQFFCTADEFTTDVTKWQGVDDEIKSNDNLVTGKGIKAGTLEEKEISYSEEDVAGYITDKNGIIIGKLMKSGAVEWTVKNSKDILLDTTVANLATQTERIDELDENAIREVEINDAEENTAAYITDKKKVIIAKINKDGSIDRLVENDKDKHTVHFEDVDIEGIANLLIDKDKKIIASINDKAEVDFYGGGGFAGEKIVEAKTWGYSKLIISKNNLVIGGIKPDGTVKIFKAEIDDLNHEDIDVTALVKSLPIVASGIDNIKISNDERVMNLLTSVNTPHIIEVQGNDIKSKLKPCISIIDDDTIDFQLPSSYGYSSVSPANEKKGGFFSLLLPLMLSLGKKYGKNLCPGLSCEGQRVGLTHLLSPDDTYTVLNENGNAVKWLHDNMGWNVFNHSMTAQLPVNTYSVESINSELADTIRTNGTYSAPFSFFNTIVLDRSTGKWYEVNSDKSAWVERVPKKKYALPFYKDYNNPSIYYFNRDFDFEYSWGEWLKRADELGLPYEKVIVHNGGTSTPYMIAAGRRYASWSVNITNPQNYPPLGATVGRMSIGTGDNNIRNTTYENTLYANVNKCIQDHSWMCLTSHFNDQAYHSNYYWDGLTYPDGDPNYPSDWITPLNHSEIQDIIGDNTHDYINHPPSRLNISTWDEWHPASGTQLMSLYNVLDYAMSNGVEFVSPMEAWGTHGNMLNIGVDPKGQSYPYGSSTPLTDEEQSFLTIGADGSIRYYSK